MSVGHFRRVLHIVPSLYADDGRVIGGAERYVLELARNMAEKVPTHLVSFGNSHQRWRDKGLHVRIVGKPWHIRGNRFNPLSGHLLAEVLRADVVHCHQQFVMASSFSALCARLSGRRVFCTDLGGWAWDISTYVNTDRWYHGHLHISRFSQHVYGHDHSARSHLIYGGVDASKFAPPTSPPAAPAPVLFVGRLLPHKGVNYLIEAMPPDLPLQIVGGPYDAPYYQLLQELAQNKKVRFILRCSDQELVAAYRGALCIVLPSVYKSVFGDESKVPELLGQTLLEGMACGLPGICTSVGSMPEVVEDGVTGFVVPPNDPAALREKILWLHAHPAEAAVMGRAARQRVLKHFTWKATVERCLEIYRQCR